MIFFVWAEWFAIARLNRPHAILFRSGREQCYSLCGLHGAVSCCCCSASALTCPLNVHMHVRTDSVGGATAATCGTAAPARLIPSSASSLRLWTNALGSSMSRLADVELQLCMHAMERCTLLRFARCDRRRMQLASHPFAFKHCDPLPWHCSETQPSPERMQQLQRGLAQFLPIGIRWQGACQLVNDGELVYTASSAEDVQRMLSLPRVAALNTRAPRDSDGAVTAHSQVACLRESAHTSCGLPLQL